MVAHALSTSASGLIKSQTDFRNGEIATVGAASKSSSLASPDRDEGDYTDGDSGNDCGFSKSEEQDRNDCKKKFICSYYGCGKGYSTASHRSRHELSHSRSQVYYCNFSGCSRSFVRLDLYTRHKERHVLCGSQLLRRDISRKRNPYLNVAATLNANDASLSSLYTMKTEEMHGVQHPFYSASIIGSGHQMPPNPITILSSLNPPQRPVSDGIYGSDSETEPHDMQSQSYGDFALLLRAAALDGYSTGHASLHNHPHAGDENLASPGLRAQTSNTSSCGSRSSPVDYQASAGGYSSLQNPPSSALSPPEYVRPTDMPVSRRQENQIYNNTYNQSPFAMADDFKAWLLNSNQFSSGGSPHINYPSAVYPVADAWPQTESQELPFEYIHPVASYLNNPARSAYLISVQNTLDTSLPETVLLDEKRKDLLDLIRLRFNGTGHAPVMAQKEAIMKGNKDDCRHVLSLYMMQSYISSYWNHVHPQLPILHKPTFDASTCPEFLLLAIMCLGASSLEKNYDQETTQSCAQLADFLAWHLRWALLMDPNARPPAKLWAIQSLLLLEVFEKMYSTRLLHERAHVYHAATWTLLRRGNSLNGRSVTDSHPGVKEKSSDGISGTDRLDEWWRRWITEEATRRAAFAAFVIDSMHATVFGHSAVIATHEMRLPLPCDEALWSVRSSSEARQAMQSDCVYPISFLDGLKKTFNKEAVKTSPFGRMILMAGLLSVSWHVNQWDLQTSSLGMTAALDTQDERLASLTHALDIWRQEDCPAPDPHGCRDGTGDDDISESQAVLYHLANMATHVDFVDCQIYAGASEVLGEPITLQDFKDAKRRMEEWAPTARARHATFHAFCLLSRVMVRRGRSPNPSNPSSDISSYSARDDHIPYRPWALYLATLVVWSYGFALEGPVQTPHQLLYYERKVEDMVVYLNRMGGVKTPEDLSKTSHLNACLGLLIIMRDLFKQTRWELLQEAGHLLTKCIERLLSHATTV
ncbi:hypothetical protein AG0111_0g11636 [Alternaria gaisen]|uniref:Uncharacterized protein n=1 Tax=Alternaria gaisen TaxID=167740 RepID=A0ACB6F6L5_9PLEO|nr:hypothetical protein AG0111_0g11636 [Alternaria gaisen]